MEPGKPAEEDEEEKEEVLVTFKKKSRANVRKRKERKATMKTTIGKKVGLPTSTQTTTSESENEEKKKETTTAKIPISTWRFFQSFFFENTREARICVRRGSVRAN